MEDQENFFTEARREISEYLEERLLLLKLQSAEKTSKLIAVMFSGFLLALVAFFILLFISIMAAYYFASLTGSLYLGFAIVAGFYILVFLLILKYQKRVLQKFITNIVIDILFDKNVEINDKPSASEQE